MAAKTVVRMRDTIGRVRGDQDTWRRRGPLLPALVFIIVMTQLPFVGTIAVSLMEWNALYPDERGFTGLDNYKTAFTDPYLRDSIVTTVVLTSSVVLVSLLLGFGLALLLDQTFPGRGVARTLLVAPFLIVPVAAALMWKHLLLSSSYGLVNGVLTWVFDLFGAEAPQPSWITEHPMSSIIASLVWQWTPFMMLILLAGLQSRPLDVEEAAKVDGANWFGIFRYLTLPHMRRYLELATVLGAIYVLQTFDAVFTITAGAYGTANLPYTVYRTFFQAQEYGVASAMGVIAVAGTILVVTLSLRTLTSLLEED